MKGFSPTSLALTFHHLREKPDKKVLTLEESLAEEQRMQQRWAWYRDAEICPKNLNIWKLIRHTESNSFGPEETLVCEARCKKFICVKLTKSWPTDQRPARDWFYKRRHICEMFFRCLVAPDFKEGIRCNLLEKEKGLKPLWNPATLKQVNLVQESTAIEYWVGKQNLSGPDKLFRNQHPRNMNIKGTHFGIYLDL